MLLGANPGAGYVGKCGGTSIGFIASVASVVGHPFAETAVTSTLVDFPGVAIM